MRLLFVSHSFPPRGRPLSNIGGMQRVAVELHTTLRAHTGVRLHDVLLRTSWRWAHVRTVPFLVKAGVQLWRAARLRTVDAVLFSSMVTAGLALPLQRVLQSSGIVTGAIVHGLDVTMPVAPYQWAVPHLFDALGQVFPVSRATGAACRQRGLSESKMQVIPNGANPARFAPPADPTAARRELLRTVDETLPEGSTLLCSVGRHVKRKGFDWFIGRVLPRLPEDVHYWLAGSGPRTEAIARAARRAGVEERVRLLGRVPEQTLRRLYRGADLFVMPNVPVSGDMEGFGVVMLEAGLSGLPTVAARLEGIQDVIEEGENGHLVAPYDAEGFADVICRYRGRAREVHMAGQQAAKYVRGTFGWPVVARRYVKALKEQQREQGSPPPRRIVS